VGEHGRAVCASSAGGRTRRRSGWRSRTGARPAGGDAPTFTTQDGFRSTRVAIMLAYAELDGGVGEDLQMPAAARAVHDELCKLEGPNHKDGVGHCPTMALFKGESHMSEVFSLGSTDKTVANAVLAFINSHK
jgi:hypothetical protein